MRRLATRVPSIDIFGDGHVRRDDDGWEITAEGRAFLDMLEAVTQDNLALETEPQDGAAAGVTEPDKGGALIIVGQRFRSRMHLPGTPLRKAHGSGSSAGIRRGDNGSS